MLWIFGICSSELGKKSSGNRGILKTDIDSPNFGVTGNAIPWFLQNKCLRVSYPCPIHLRSFKIIIHSDIFRSSFVINHSIIRNRLPQIHLKISWEVYFPPKNHGPKSWPHRPGNIPGPCRCLSASSSRLAAPDWAAATAKALRPRWPNPETPKAIRGGSAGTNGLRLGWGRTIGKP